MDLELIYEEFKQAGIARNEALALEKLKSPEVMTTILEKAPNDNHALRLAAGFNLYKLMAELLLIPEVRANAAVDDNYCLRLMAGHGCLAGVELLLEIPEVLENITVNNLYVLRIAAALTDLSMVKRLIREPAVANHVDGIKGALKLAYKNESKMVCYELHKLLGKPGYGLMQPLWRNRLQRDLNDVLDSKVALAQVYKDLKGVSSSRYASNPLYSLSGALWMKIAEYTSEANLELKERKELLPMHLFVTMRNYNFLLKEAVAAVDGMDYKKALKS